MKQNHDGTYTVCDDLLVGKTEDRDRVYMSVVLRPAQQHGQGQTINHEPIPYGTLELAMTFSRVGKGRKLENAWCCGAGTDWSLGDVVLPESSFTMEDVRILKEIADRWHLNAFKAGCAHQPESSLVRDPNSYNQVDLDRTPACSVTGYKYGTAWLCEPIPALVIIALITIIERGAGKAS